MNQVSKIKRKLTYFEFKDIFKELTVLAKEESDKQGRTVTIGEIVRRASLEKANEHRKKNGKKLLDLDTSAGKFAPSGQMAADQCIVNADGKTITVYSKNGSIMSAYQKLSQLPTLLQHFPKVKMVYEMPKAKKKA